MNATDPIVMPGYAKERALIPVMIYENGVQPRSKIIPALFLTNLLAAGCGARPFGLQYLN